MAQTKLQLVNYVTNKFGVTTDDVVSIAKDFYDARYRMIWDERVWKESITSESITVAVGTQTVTTSVGIERVISVRWFDYELLPVNQQQVFRLNATAWDTSGEVVAFTEISRDSSGNAQLKLFRIPEVQKTLVIIGKMPSETLSDNQKPKLTGIDQCLHAFVLGDLWQYARQYGKANLLFEEARFHLKNMYEIEEEQSAYNNQILPYDDGQWNRDYLDYY